MLILVAAVTVLAVIVVVGVIVGLKSGTNPPRANGSPSPTANATGTLQQTSTCTPSNVKLADNKDSITLTWTEPAGCEAPLVILGGPRGAQPTIQKQLDPGASTLTLQGLNSATDYCYVVLAVVSAQGYAKSPQVCTKRF
jgi:hypothetical protein